MAPYEPVSAAAIWAQLAPPLPSIQSEEVAGHSLTSVFHLAHELGGGGGCYVQPQKIERQTGQL